MLLSRIFDALLAPNFIVVCVLSASLLACAIIESHASAPPEITISSLLHEMTDRRAFAQLPSAPFLSKQASSYDRRSVSPNEPGWFANNDWSQYIRDEVNDGRTEHVMMDAKGPGCITRFWMGAPTPDGSLPGELRIYLDGNTEPTITETSDQLCGGKGPIPPPFSQITCIGRNLYFPIPYAKSCKVTYDGNANCWYNIEYRTYAPNTKVRTFTWDEFKTVEPLSSKIGMELLTPQNSLPTAKLLKPVNKTLATGEHMDVELHGSQAIRKLSIQLTARDMESALRSTVLIISFDGERTVWCPVGDFFGSGVGLNPYRDWDNEVDRDGLMTCYWVMPFEKSCSIELLNLGSQSVNATLGSIAVTPWKWDKRSMHFHSTWRQQANMETKRQDGFDWNYLQANGDGVYMGDSLAMYNGSSDWWGEGDEKIFVDGEKFPSHFGTGTEDYYGYSFGNLGTFFEAPFHAEARWDGNSKPGFVSVTRVRTLDAIPFHSSLNFDMEIWHWAQTQVTYAVTCYWYARPGATCNREPMPEEATKPIADLK